MFSAFQVNYFRTTVWKQFVKSFLPFCPFSYTFVFLDLLYSSINAVFQELCCNSFLSSFLKHHVMLWCCLYVKFLGESNDDIKCCQICKGKQKPCFNISLSSGNSRCYKVEELYTRWESVSFYSVAAF